MRKRTVWLILVSCACLGITAAVWSIWPGRQPGPDVIEVHPGEDIQAALEAGALRPVKPIIRVHAGLYRPAAPNEALVYFNSRHDGIILEGVGEVILTAANPDLADHRAASYPAIVNHVVYFGDGISEKTVFRNFKLTGARGFVQAPPHFRPLKTAEDLVRLRGILAYESAIEANRELPKTHVFYTDGGGILAYGRSYPTVENVAIYDNSSSVCAGGVSVQHQGLPPGGAIRFRNCIFRDNHAGTSGSAVDLLTEGSWAIFENCLFTGNISDEKIVLPQNTRFGALSVFPYCRVNVRNCTFTDNCSGVDDRGESTYEKTIFWKNSHPGGLNTHPPFEVNLTNAEAVTGCWLGGRQGDLKGNVSRTDNRFDAPDPEFDEEFCPRNPLYEGVGYRPERQLPEVTP